MAVLFVAQWMENVTEGGSIPSVFDCLIGVFDLYPSLISDHCIQRNTDLEYPAIGRVCASREIVACSDGGHGGEW